MVKGTCEAVSLKFFERGSLNFEPVSHLGTYVVLGKRKKGLRIQEPALKHKLSVVQYPTLPNFEDDKKLYRIATSPASEFFQEKVL